MKHLKTIFAVMISLLLVIGVAFADTQRLGGTSFSFNPTKSVTKTAAYTATTSDSQIRVDATSSAITITLPSVESALTGKRLVLKVIKTDSSTNMVTVTAGTGDTIGGEASRKVINQNDYIVIQAGPGSDWRVAYETSYLAEDHLNGTVALVGGANAYSLFNLITASQSLTSANCGQTIGIQTDALTATLPVSVSNCSLTFMNVGPANTSLLTVMAASGETIFGTVGTTAAPVTIATSMKNTKASSHKGDFITLYGIASSSWGVKDSVGIWTQ